MKGGQTFFGFVKRYLAYLWVCYLVHNRHIFGVAEEQYDKVSATLTFHKNIEGQLPQNAIKRLVFMYHKARSIFLGSKNVLNLVYFWVV